jgi:S1-C subfamily serine protease
LNPRALLPLVVAAALCGAPALPASAAPSSAALESIQKEFKNVIQRGTPATVNVTAKGSVFGCSGVMVSPRGYVLSSFDAGKVLRSPDAAPTYTSEVMVRVPDMKTNAFVEYEGRIVKTLKELDSALIQILKPPPGGFKCLAPATSDGLHVGSFTFAAGNAFGMAREALPGMTAGVLAAVTYLPRGESAAGGRFEALYTGAAVMPGVAGGPLLDVEGRLVGIIAGSESVTPDNPFQLLGRAVPIDRLRAAYGSLSDSKEVLAAAKEAFSEKPAKADPAKSPESKAIETVIAKAAGDAYESVASLVVERTAPLNALAASRKGPVQLPRYVGPASAVAVSADGWLVTSLYNLTSVVEMQFLQLAPEEARVSTGLSAITKITAHFKDGASGEAKVVATHVGLGIALLKADVVGRRPIEPAQASAYAPGRFLVPVANPFGDKPSPDPLMNFGVVSKRHADALTEPWHGQIQTDAGGTDGNCGAAVVDVEGKLVGVLTLWNPIEHGRNSGIAFVVPWDRIETVLLSMKEGRSYRFPRIGVEWFVEEGKRFDAAKAAKVAVVAADGPAHKVGILPGDVVVALGDAPVASIFEFIMALVGRIEGEHVAVTVQRDGKPVTFDLELGARD